MVASRTKPTTLEERAAILGDSAFHVLARHGVKGRSVVLELELWRTIRNVLHRRERIEHMFGPINGTCELLSNQAAEITAAVYDVALRHGFDVPFVDVELALWASLRRAASPKSV
jgi:hypothetical protein